jgi:hypothetical protein
MIVNQAYWIDNKNVLKSGSRQIDGREGEI